MNKGARLTPTEVAKELGVDPSKVGRTAKRHGVKMGADGKYDAEEITRARLAGLEMDKSKKLVEAEAAEPGTLSQAKLIAQIEKLKIETKMLQLELEEAEGKLVPVDDAVAIVTRREAEMATRLRVWEESETAKSPSMREIIREAADALRDLMREPVEF